MSAGPSVSLTARPPKRLFYPVFEPHDGRALAMEAPLEQQKPLDTSAGASNELVKLIRKLRWMGMEEEAERMMKELTRRRATAADSVLGTPGETD